MRVLFAPWRYKYVTGNKERTPGMFKNIIASSDDEANFVLGRSNHCVVILNTYPYSSGHLMILPKREVDSLDSLSPEESSEMMELASKAVSALKRVYTPDGFNIGLNIGAAAGAGISEHLHMHVVPRWNGDSNFMTATADTRVVPEDLREAYKKISAVLSELL